MFVGRRLPSIGPTTMRSRTSRSRYCAADARSAPNIQAIGHRVDAARHDIGLLHADHDGRGLGTPVNHSLHAPRELKPGKVDWRAVHARLREQGIVLVGGGADEAPEVYKRLPEVLDAHAGSIRVKHTLRPLGVAMAGRGVYDPFKD